MTNRCIPIRCLPTQPDCSLVSSRINFNINGVEAEPIMIDRTLFVDSNYGNDGTGERENLSLPYRTLNAALLAAVPQDTVYVWPGTYTLTAPLALNSNVNFHFTNDAVVISPQSVFVAQSDIASTISGFGSFTISGTSSLIDTLATGSQIDFEATRVDLGEGSRLLVATSFTSVNMKINRMISASTTTSTILLNQDAQLTLEFDVFDIASTFLESLAESQGLAVIEGSIFRATSDFPVFALLGSLDVEVDIEEVELRSEQDAYLVFAADDAFIGTITRVFEFSAITLVESRLASLTNSLLYLSADKLFASSIARSIYAERSSLTIDINAIVYTGRVDQEFAYVIDSHYFFIKADSIALGGVASFITARALEQDVMIYLEIENLLGESNLFDLGAEISNLDLSARIVSLVLTNVSVRFITTEGNVSMDLMADRMTINNFDAGAFQSGLLSHVGPRNTIYNIGELTIDINSLGNIFRFDENNTAVFNVDRVVLGGDESTLIYAINESIVTVDIKSIIVSAAARLFFMVTSTLNGTIKTFENELIPLLILSDRSYITLDVGRYTTSNNFTIVSQGDPYFNLQADSIEYVGPEVIALVSFIAITNATEAYITANSLNFGESNRGLVVSGSVLTLTADYIESNTENQAIRLNGFGERLYMNVDRMVSRGTNPILVTGNGAFANIYIRDFFFVGNADEYAIRLEQPSGTTDIRIDKLVSSQRGIYSNTNGLLTFYTDFADSSGVLADITTNGSSNILFSGYFRSSADPVFLFTVGDGLGIVRFRSSTIVAYGTAVNSMVSTVVRDVQMEPSLANKPIVNINVTPDITYLVPNPVVV